MSKISTWSTTAASNNSVSPDGFPESMAPSGVNNSAREVMAAVRTQHEAAEWIDLGLTPTQTGATTFTLVGDQTAQYNVGRRVKCTDLTTLYGTITVSAFTSLTTVTVVLDSGSLSASLTAVALGIISGVNNSHPRSAIAVDDATDSTSGTTGSIQTDGGIGAVKDIVTDANFKDANGDVKGLVLQTATATTSGASHEYTSIPSWVKRITITLEGTNISSSDGAILIQIGDSGGYETTGYVSQDASSTSSTTLVTSSTNGFHINWAVGGVWVLGSYTWVLTLADSSSNKWIGAGSGARSDAAQNKTGSCIKSLSGTLDRLRLTTATGADTFTAGSFNVMYE